MTVCRGKIPEGRPEQAPRAGEYPASSRKGMTSLQLEPRQPAGRMVGERVRDQRRARAQEALHPGQDPGFH